MAIPKTRQYNGASSKRKRTLSDSPIQVQARGYPSVISDHQGCH